MSMAADTAHRFWLGEVNVTVALARGQIKANGPVAKILKLVPLAKPVFPRYKALLEAQGRADLVERPRCRLERRGAGPRRSRASPTSAGCTTSRSAGSTRRRPGRALPGRHQPDHRPARHRVLGRVLRRRRARGRAASSRRPCCRARSSPRRTCPTSPKVVPMFNVESVEPGEKVEQLASRRKVEFESIDFNKRFLATVPADHDPIALRELFSPGFLDWAAQIPQRVRVRHHRPASSTSPGASASSTPTSTRRRSTTPAGSSSAFATRWRSRACTPTSPAPGTPAWSRSRQSA